MLHHTSFPEEILQEMVAISVFSNKKKTKNLSEDVFQEEDDFPAIF